MIAREPPPQRTPEDFHDAAGLRAAGHDIMDVAEWTHLSRRQVRSVKPEFADPIPSPTEVWAAAAMIRADWDENERQTRCCGARDVYRIPLDVSPAPSNHGESG